MGQVTSKGSPSQSASLIALLLIVGGLGGTYQFLLPMLRTEKEKLAKLTAESAGYEQDIAALHQVEVELSAGKAELQRQGTSLTKLQSVVPQTEDVPGLYIQLEQLMKEASPATAAYQVGAPVEESPGVAKVPVSITATGTYGDLKRFITRLELNIRPLTFTTVTFSAAQASAQVQGQSTQQLPDGSLNLVASGFVRSVRLSPAYATKK